MEKTINSNQVNSSKPSQLHSVLSLVKLHHHHHQPINVPTAGAQAFLMDYPQGEQAMSHHVDPMRIGGC
jgi:hypothetical protein